MSHLSVKAESVLLPMVYECIDLQEIVDAAATFVGTPIRFSPENNPDLSFVSPGYPMEDIKNVKQTLSDDRQGFQTFTKVIDAAKNRDEPIFFTSEDGSCTKIFCNIAVGSRYFGNLSIPKVGVALESIDIDLVMTVARMLGLSCAVHGVWGYDRSGEDVLKALLLGAVENRMQLAMRAKDWKSFQDKKWRLVCAVLPENMSEAILLSGLERVFPLCPTAFIDKTATALIDVSAQDIKASQREQLAVLAQRLKTVVLIGSPFGDALACNKVYLSMLAFPQMRNPSSGAVFDCDRFRDYSLFWSSGLKHDELKQYADPVVATIEAYDRKQNTEYLPTLKAYLNSGRNIAEAASTLSIHANTVNYRIKRLHELFGIDPSDAEAMYSIAFTFRLLDYMEC